MRFLPHFATKKNLGEQIGVHDGFLGRVHASFRKAARPIGRTNPRVQ